MVLVGARKDSETYVRSKKKACGEAGINSFGTDLPEDATEDEVLAVKACCFCQHITPGVTHWLIHGPHRLSSTGVLPTRPTRVLTPGRHSIGYTDYWYTGCRQLAFGSKITT